MSCLLSRREPRKSFRPLSNCMFADVTLVQTKQSIPSMSLREESFFVAKESKQQWSDVSVDLSACCLLDGEVTMSSSRSTSRSSSTNNQDLWSEHRSSSSCFGTDTHRDLSRIIFSEFPLDQISSRHQIEMTNRKSRPSSCSGC